SPCDASFIAEGETDGFAHRAPLPRTGRTNPADWESEWTEINKTRYSSDSPATHAQVPALQSSLCDASSSRSASVGNPWSEEEESGLICSQSANRSREAEKKENKVGGSNSGRRSRLIEGNGVAQGSALGS